MSIRKVFGKEAAVVAVHAGLECGIIGEKFPGMDMISFGPTITHPHSPEEGVEIASVENFWKLLTAALRDFGLIHQFLRKAVTGRTRVYGEKILFHRFWSCRSSFLLAPLPFRGL